MSCWRSALHEAGGTYWLSRGGTSGEGGEPSETVGGCVRPDVQASTLLDIARISYQCCATVTPVYRQAAVHRVTRGDQVHEGKMMVVTFLRALKYLRLRALREVGQTNPVNCCSTSLDVGLPCRESKVGDRRREFDTFAPDIAHVSRHCVRQRPSSTRRWSAKAAPSGSAPPRGAVGQSGRSPPAAVPYRGNVRVRSRPLRCRGFV